MMNLDDMVRYAPLMGLAGTQQRFQQYADRERGIRYEDRIPSRELWGRAMSDQINQYFANLPQYIQMQRQHALDKEKLAYERQQRDYQNKLNPLLLRQQQIANQIQEQKLGVYDGYYERIETLPIPDAQKEMLRGMTPAEGVPVISSIVQTLATRKPPTTYKTLQPNTPGNPSNVPVQLNTATGEIKTPFSASDMESWSAPDPNNPKVQALAQQMNVGVEKLLPYIKQNNKGELKYEDTFSAPVQQQFINQNQKPSTQRLIDKFPDPSQIISFSDLAPFAGNSIADQRSMALNVLNPDTIGFVHPLYEQAKNEHNRKYTISGPKGFVALDGRIEDYQTGKKPVTANAPESINVARGDSASNIVNRFKAQGKEVKLSQLVASNPDYFTDQDPNKMKTTEEVGRPMTIPIGGPNLNNAQVRKAQQSFAETGGQGIQVKGFGTIYPVHTMGPKQVYELNVQRDDMQKLMDNIDQLMSLYEEPNVGVLKLGEYRGAMESISWRIINNIQRLRDYGVISPGELETLRESVPDPNAFFAKIKEDVGGKQYIKGVFNALRQEAERQRNLSTLYLKSTSSPIYTEGMMLSEPKYRPLNLNPVTQNPTELLENY